MPVLFYHIVNFNLFFEHTRSLLVPNAYISIESTDCILFSLLALNAVLFISSANTLCFSLLIFALVLIVFFL